MARSGQIVFTEAWRRTTSIKLKPGVPVLAPRYTGWVAATMLAMSSDSPLHALRAEIRFSRGQPCAAPRSTCEPHTSARALAIGSLAAGPGEGPRIDPSPYAATNARKGRAGAQTCRVGFLLRIGLLARPHDR